MAAALKPLTFASVTVAAAGTSVSPSSPVPDNCVGLLVVNRGANPLLYGIGTPGGALTEGTTAGVVGVGGSISLPIGAIAARGVMDATQLAGTGLIFDASGGATTATITYINQTGP